MRIVHLLVIIIRHESLFCMSSYFQSMENEHECMDACIMTQAFIS